MVSAIWFGLSTMKFYVLQQNDQRRSSWVLATMVKKAPPRKRNSEVIPSTVHKLLGQRPEGEMRMKDIYRQARCQTCRRYDPHDMVEIGFDDDVIIKIKGDFAHTNDRILLITQKFLDVLTGIGARGFETKPIGDTGWHALRVTCLKEIADGVMKDFGERCTECSRAEYSAGILEKVSDLDILSGETMMFTTRQAWPRAFSDRDTVITEDIVLALKKAGIKGGHCYRLLSDDEWKKKEREGGDRWPPRSMTYL